MLTVAMYKPWQQDCCMVLVSNAARQQCIPPMSQVKFCTSAMVISGVMHTFVDSSQAILMASDLK